MEFVIKALPTKKTLGPEGRNNTNSIQTLSGNGNFKNQQWILSFIIYRENNMSISQLILWDQHNPEMKAFKKVLFKKEKADKWI